MPLLSRVLPFGRMVGLGLPPAGDAAALSALVAELPAEERARAQEVAPAVRATWVGGRLALRAALADLGVEAGAIGAIGATDRGAPALPAGLVGSISHKETIAVALAARAPDGATVGVDVEIDRAPRVDISGRVLTEDERRVVSALPPGARTRETLVAFAAKEAIYKALDPWVRRSVSFQEVALARAPDGTLLATLRLAGGEGPFTVEVHEEPADGLVLVAARVSR